MADEDDEDYEEEEDESDEEEQEENEEEVERVEPDEDDYKFDTRKGFFKWYTCQNVGCLGKRHFRHNKETWFTEERDGNPPASCKLCNEWKAEQKRVGPILVTCHWCKEISWQVSASARIMFKKYDGRWDKDHQICYRCKEYPGRKRKMEYRLAQKAARDPFFHEGKELSSDTKERIANTVFLEKKEVIYEKSKSKLTTLIEDRVLDTTPRSYEVPSDIAFYSSILTPKHKIKDHGPTRLTHIMKKSHKWQEQFGTEDASAILDVAHHIAISQEEHILQFEGESEHAVYKYDTEHEVLVILQASNRSSTGYMLITSYEMDIDQVVGKIKDQKWVGAWDGPEDNPRHIDDD